MLVSGYNNIILLPNCTMLYYVFSGPLSLRAYVPEIKFNNKNNNNKIILFSKQVSSFVHSAAAKRFFFASIVFS